MIGRLRRWAPPVDADPGARSRRLELASWLFVAMGIGFYAVNFLGGKSLWLDEAMVALNVRHLSYAELTGKLDYDQLAPVGWLFLQKFIYEATGNLEYGLRALSFGASAGALILFRQVAFRVLSAFGAASAVLLFALLGAIVRYAAEVKPYTVDVFLALGIMAAAVALLSSARPGWVRYALFAAVGAMTTVLSFAAAYVLAAAAAAVFIHALLNGRRGGAIAIAAISIGWLVPFLALLLAVYFPQLGGSELVEGGSAHFFARAAFAPFPPMSVGDVVWYVAWGRNFLEFLFHPEAFVAAGVLVGVGAFALVRRSVVLGLLFLGPLAIALVASSFHLYPLFDRLILFLTPGLFIAMGAAVDWLVIRSRGGVAAPAALVAAVAIGSTPFILGNLGASPPFALQHIRPLLAELRSQVKPGDLIYVGNLATPAYLLYRGEYGLAPIAWRPGHLIEPTWSCVVQDLPRDRRTGRVWFVLAELGTGGMDDEGAFGALLAARGLTGSLHLQAEGPQTLLFRVDLSPSADPPKVTPKDQTCGAHSLDNRFDPPPRLREREARASHGT
jgi:hypothetical protein